MIRNYRDLEVYQRAGKLYTQIYRLTQSFPESDRKEIGSQMRRAANSIIANLAEGYCKSEISFKKYLTDSLGSCDELLTHLNLAHAIGLIANYLFQSLTSNYIIVGKQLYRLRERWRKY